MDFNTRLTEVFGVLDREDNKTIPIKDLAKGLRACGLNPTESQVQQYMTEAVILDGNLLDFPEFQKIAAKCQDCNLVTQEEVLNFFKSFDTKNLNYLTEHELIQALCASGDKLDPREIDTLMKDFDKDGTGKINIKDFVDGLFRV